jgi:hypothetical protein
MLDVGTTTGQPAAYCSWKGQGTILIWDLFFFCVYDPILQVEMDCEKAGLQPRHFDRKRK